MAETIIDKLKNEKVGWEETLRLRISIYKTTIVQIKQREFELKKAKQSKYQALKQVKEAKMKVKKLDSKIKCLPSRVRRWNRDNFGKVIDSMEK